MSENTGNDKIQEVPIPYSQAALRSKIEFPKLTGKAELKITAGTQTHTIFKMRGKGTPSLHGYGYGNQLVKVIIQTPKKLTKKQKELLTQFDKKKKKGFFNL